MHRYHRSKLFIHNTIITIIIIMTSVGTNGTWTEVGGWGGGEEGEIERETSSRCRNNDK